MNTTTIAQNLVVLGAGKVKAKQEHLNHSTGNILFILAIVGTILLNVWMTRGIHNFREVTTCCTLAIGMSLLTVLYFIMGNVLINGGLGMNKDAVVCTAISKTMMSAYFAMKVYMGFFFFKKLREIVNMVSKGYTRTSKQISVKGSFYYIFPPILVVFIACGLFSVSGIETHLKLRDVPRPGKRTFCVLTISHSYMLVPFFALLTISTVATFATSFLCSSPLFSRNIRNHPGSPAAGTAALLSAIIPFVSCACFIGKGGRETASLTNLAWAVDVMVMHVLVWATEGQWSLKSTEMRSRVCKCVRLPSQIVGERGIEDRKERIMEVRALHRGIKMEEELLLRDGVLLGGEGDGGVSERIDLGGEQRSGLARGVHDEKEGSPNPLGPYLGSLVNVNQKKVEREYRPTWV